MTFITLPIRLETFGNENTPFTYHLRQKSPRTICHFLQYKLVIEQWITRESQAVQYELKLQEKSNGVRARH